MLNEDQIRIINSALARFAPKQIGLFGSRVRGDYKKESDLDVLISFRNGKSPYSLLELLAVENSLAEVLGYPVEIINEKHISNKKIREKIIEDLQIIYFAPENLK
ncbi:MAG: nucleotidyltransferase family protein [Ginsengibacter sp.]